MKKLYLQLLFAIDSGNNKCIKAVRIFFLAFIISSISFPVFATVIITPASGGTTICGSTAVSGTNTCTALGPIGINEGANADFLLGADQIILSPPSGWQFCTVPAPVAVFAAGGDVTAVSTIITSSTLTINISSGGVAAHDSITITGLHVVPILATAAPGYIYASGTVGVSGITSGAGPGTSDFGDLALTPAQITGDGTACKGSTDTLHDATPGGIWTSSSNAIATVGSSSGVVYGVTAGSVTITYSAGGCYALFVITVANSVLPITGVHNICAWGDTVRVADANIPAGVWSSTLVTIGSTGLVTGYASGVGTITYTVPTGCTATAFITVNPLPGDIMGPDSVCQGNSITLTDTMSGGRWSSTNTGVATVDSLTGTVYGSTGGLTTIVYTSPFGCKKDTTIKVNPSPAAITGPNTVCVGSNILLTDDSLGGTWSSVSLPIATVDISTGIVYGVSPGVAFIFYMLPTTCSKFYTVTVDPVPAAISGPDSVCVGGSVLFTEDSTGGTWTVSDGTIATVDVSGNVTGLGVGVATVTYMLPAGNCFVTHVITVNPVPKPIYGPDSVCVGHFVMLQDSTHGGIWSSSSAVALITSPTDSSCLVNGIAPGGSAVITYTLATGCSTSFNIVVNPAPGPISYLKDSICVGETTLLSEPGSPGGFWSAVDTTIASIDSFTGVVIGKAPGTTNINYTLPAGGCSQITPFVIHVFGPPAIPVGDTTVCVGDSILLTDATPGGTWSCSIPSVATIDMFSGWLYGLSLGGVTITYTGPAGCTSLFGPVHVNPLSPTFGPTSFCQGSTVTYTNGTPTAGGVWGVTNPAIATVDATGDVTGLLPGVDTVVYTLPTGCTAYFGFTVNPFAPIVGDSTLCVNSSITLTDASPGGTWSTYSGGGVATIDGSGNVFGVSAGTDTVYYLLPTGCPAQLTITVNPIPPPISPTPDSVCVGSTISLFDDSEPAGVWGSGDVSIATVSGTGIVGGVSGGVVAITYSFPATGCYVTVLVTVNPLLGITPNPAAVCVDDSIQLSDATPGGPGVWSSNDNSIATIGATGWVYGVSAGTVVITYLLPLTGCNAIDTVTVNPLPSPITGSDTLCNGGTTTLSDATPGGIWSSGSTGVATVEDTTGIVHGVSVGVANITYTLPTGCITFTTVTVDPTPPAIIGPGDVCLGFSILLTDDSTGGVWSTSNGAVATVTTGGLVTGLSAPDTAIIFYTFPTGGCGVGKTIHVHPIPVITVITPAIICKGASDTLQPSGAGAGGSYFWTPSYALSCTSCPNPIASPTITTTYTVVGTTVYGCSDTTTVVVLIDSELNHLLIVGKDSICAGQCDTLMASGDLGTLFKWHPINGLSDPVGDTVIACPSATTTYVGVVIDYLGCRDSSLFKVTVNPIPQLKVIPSPVIVCRGTPTQVAATGAGPGGRYAWTPNLFISCDSCFDPIFTDTFNLVYKLTGTTIYGCYDSTNVKVSVLDTNLNTISNDTDICIGDSVQLFATSRSLYSNLDVPTFYWTPGSFMNDQYIPDPIVTPTITTTYTAHITENICYSKDLTVTVRVQPLPSINIVPGSVVVVAGTPTTETALAPNVTVAQYMWIPNNGSISCDTCSDPILTPTVATTYTVTVVSIYGCTSKDTVTIQMYCDNSEVFIPNTFTPNGDGVNDRFFVSGKGITLILNMKVYNRWGQLLFEAHNINPNDPGAGWDGTYKGVVLEPDVFVYLVDAICERGTKFSYKGDVSIVR